MCYTSQQECYAECLDHCFHGFCSQFCFRFFELNHLFGFFLTAPFPDNSTGTLYVCSSFSYDRYSNTFLSPRHLPRKYFPHIRNTFPFTPQIYLIGTTGISDKPLVHHCIFKQSQKIIYKVPFKYIFI